jgi:hypothetical protein
MGDDEHDDRQKEAINKIKRLMRDFPSVERNADIKATLESITGQIEETDAIYPLLKHKLVGSGFDAKHIRKLLHLSATTAKRINSTAKDFNLKEKIIKLKRIHKSDLSRHLAIEYASGDFCYAPTFEFFYGAIKQEGLVVKERKRRAKVDLTDQNATQTKATERDIRTDCEQDSTPKEVEAIYNKVKRLATSKPDGAADFLSSMVDSESFPHTVENFFHFSFLVREGRVGVEKGESNKPVMKIVQESQPRRWNQSIMSFSMADYKKWIAKSDRQVATHR